jgi:DNA transposition AAA+ family ATPase
MEEIINVLKPGTHQGQHVAVVVGMGGSGKTQLSLKYAYDNDSQ